jgi:hypothetical protein
LAKRRAKLLDQDFKPENYPRKIQPGYFFFENPMKENFHFEILDEKRRKIYPLLSFLTGHNFYLAGGTALALQLGHRTSVDFDFYSPKNFKKGAILKLIKKNIPQLKLKVLRDFDDTFEAVLEGEVNISFFYYGYPMLEKFVPMNGLKVASVADIAAMKIIAITQRGKRRDFVDIYYLLKIYSLEEIFNFTQRKFKEFDIYNGLRGLVYFDEAEDDLEINRIKVLNQKLNWKDVRKKIVDSVKEFS